MKARGRIIGGLLPLLCCAIALGVEVPLEVTESGGAARANAPVRSGVPFPIGALKTNDSLKLADPSGRGVPLQFQTMATWRDGSVKWALLDFQTDIASHETKRFVLASGGQTSVP